MNNIGCSDEDLGTLFARKIAEMEGIPVEEVTVEYILQQREKRIYPNINYEAPLGLWFFTRKELDRIEFLNDEFMNNLDNYLP